MQTELVTRQQRPLTERQQEVLSLVTQYYAVALELPSTRWLSRRLQISPKRAWQHMDLLRARNLLR